MVKISLETGIVTCEFREMHKWAEKIIGHPIWTHEFAMDDTWLDLKIGLVLYDEGYPRSDIPRHHPLQTLREVAPDKPVIGVIVKEDGG